MKPAYKFFGKSALKIGAFAVVYGLFMMLMLADEYSSVGENFDTILGFLVIMQVAMQTKLYRMDIILSLSFGQSRKNIFMGTLFSDLMLLFINLCFTAVIFVIGNEGMEKMISMLIAVISMTLLGNAFGNYFGMIQSKFGQKKFFGMALVLGMVCAVVVLTTAIITQTELVVFLSRKLFLYISLAVCIVFYIIQCFVRRRFVMKFVY